MFLTLFLNSSKASKRSNLSGSNFRFTWPDNHIQLVDDTLTWVGSRTSIIHSVKSLF